jgi:signal transduction histidine kinase
MMSHSHVNPSISLTIGIPPPGPQAKLAPRGGDLADVLITEELFTRSQRQPRFEAESKALRTLARVAANSPEKLLDTLLQLAVELCHADSAGLSLLETNPAGDRIFRWTNLAGVLRDHVGGFTPREFSPCGVCLDHGYAQLFSYPERHFYYLNIPNVPFVEALVVPLVEKTPLGTIWIVSHNPAGRFDAEDVRIMNSLAEFTSSALEMTRLVGVEHQGRKKIESELQDRTAMLRKLSSRLIGAQDEERRRIASALHDSVGQYLSVLKINLDRINDGSAPQHSEILSECLEEVDQCLLETRTISHLLHPPLLDEAGLLSAAQWYISEFSRRSKMAAAFDAPAKLHRLPHEIEIVLFRALQENLTNVYRHSQSLKVDISLNINDENISLMIKDYGIGLPQGMVERFLNNENGFGVGLAGMRERVHELKGRIDLQSDSNGTQITVTIPLANDGAATEPGLQFAWEVV